MRTRILAGLGATASAGVLALLSVTWSASAQVQDHQPPPGEGVLCSWALVTLTAEVGRMCHAGESPEVQAELDAAVARFDAFVLANSTPSATPESVAEFKRVQGKTGASAEMLCASSDAERMYQTIVSQDLVRLRESVDQLLARPGPPSWGTCL
jgi:hypothetical protein